MRIVGYIEHPLCKITIMHMNHRYAVKFENEGIEQTYKIRESETISSVNDVKTVISPEIIERIMAQFSAMETIRMDILSSGLSDDFEFEEII
ncbi:hypothetical protein [Portibacter lacus]|uniref:Uncharacterized protein n=1 Tax=Portibacter lacus TaxID=1099794 RepID=A0AA37SMU2_9BACT|nr:hypothetical protein [Portibacter lacus]GLR16264.1 hypothetical protein GCM10007940_08790 [Portibacter lacus]